MMVMDLQAYFAFNALECPFLVLKTLSTLDEINLGLPQEISLYYFIMAYFSGIIFNIILNPKKGSFITDILFNAGVHFSISFSITFSELIMK